MYQSNTIGNYINTESRGLTTKNIAFMMYLLFWILKPFYLFESGSVQPGDAFLGLSFLTFLVGNNLRLSLRKIDACLYLFFLCVFGINVLHFVFLQETAFLKPILYYIFNFFVVYLFREFSAEQRFFQYFASVLKLNIWMQLILLITGLGEWFGGVRYIGSYNDPNQLAFGLMSTYCLLYCISRIITVKRRWLYFAIVAFLIYKSSSTGMLAGIAILFVCEQYFRLVTIKGDFNKALYVIYLLIITMAFLFFALELISVINSGDTDIFFLKRLVTKLDKGDSFVESFIKDRNIYPLLNAPFRILYGSGEGQMSRFCDSHLEIHSTWLGLLFYYGIIPFCILISWIGTNLKKTDLYALPVYLCVFAEAFTLVNHRQPSFWTLIALAYMLKRKSAVPQLGK